MATVMSEEQFSTKIDSIIHSPLLHGLSAEEEIIMLLSSAVLIHNEAKQGLPPLDCTELDERIKTTFIAMIDTMNGLGVPNEE